MPVLERVFYEGLVECRDCGLEITRTSRLSDIEAWQDVVSAWNRRYAEDLKQSFHLFTKNGLGIYLMRRAI